MYPQSKVILIFSAAILIAGISFAKDSEPPEKESGGMGYSMLGSGTINIDDLNAKLESKGYSALSDNFFSVGGGGHSIINQKWIIGGEGHTLLGDEETAGNMKHSLNITYGFFDVGYIIYSVNELRIYPMLGIGGGGMNLKISEKIASLSMDDVLDNPNRGITISSGGFLINLALGVDYLLNLGHDENGRGGMLFGIRAGYTVAPSKGGWTMDDIDISGAPKIGMTGPYIRFMIGGGGFGKED